MKYDMYTDISFMEEFSIFEFESIGPLGKIKKRVEISTTAGYNIFTLAFGDVDEDNNIDDYAISNNGDRNKILATIVKIVKIYFDRFPERTIFFKGSTAERTRLYRIAISVNLEELSTNLEIYAIVENEIFTFYKNINADGFIIKRKIIIL